MGQVIERSLKGGLADLGHADSHRTDERVHDEMAWNEFNPFLTRHEPTFPGASELAEKEGLNLLPSARPVRNIGTSVRDRTHHTYQHDFPSAC